MTAATIIPSGARAYLGTPYTDYPAGIDQAAADAAKVAGLLLRSGVKVYSPIAHGHAIAAQGGIDPKDRSIWLPFNEAMMEVHDVLIIAHLPTWETSKGLAFEIEYFTKKHRPIFDLPNPLDPSRMTKRNAKAPFRLRFENMTLAQLEEERAYWDVKIRDANGWGEGLAAANAYRCECERWIAIKKQEAEGVPA